MTIREKAEKYDAAVFADDPDRIDDLKAAYQAGYKEALNSALRFLKQYGTNGQKESCISAELNDWIEKELGE